MPFACKLAVIAALILGLGAVPMAAAQEEGVTIDPGSPSAKEYALPIETARRNANPGGGGSSLPGRPAPDRPAPDRPTPGFGEGVRPDRAAGSPGGSTSSTPRSGTTGPGVAPAERAQEREAIDRALVTAGVGDRGGSDGSLALLIGGVVVMVLGVAGGLTLRHRTR